MIQKFKFVKAFDVFYRRNSRDGFRCNVILELL